MPLGYTEDMGRIKEALALDRFPAPAMNRPRSRSGLHGISQHDLVGSLPVIDQGCGIPGMLQHGNFMFNALS